MIGSTSQVNVPDARGYYGKFGGRFVPETLVPALDELTAAYLHMKNDPEFQAELANLHRTYTGRPTPISYAHRLTEYLGGAQIYIKREDLAHSGAHKINNALGPHPYPLMVRDFQSVIGIEAKQQIVEQAGRLPDAIVACVGGGSNAIGMFHAFRDDADVKLIGVEAGGHGIESGLHAARFSDPKLGRLGVLHGTRSYVMQNADGQIAETHSISAGLEYDPVGSERHYLRSLGPAEHTIATH